MIFLLLVFCIINVFSLIWHKSEKSDIVKRKLRPWTKEKNVKCMHWKDFEILIAKNAYLTTELIQHIHEVSLENGLQDSIIKDNHLLKKRFVEELGNSIGFYIVSKKQIVYCSEVNSCKYAVATIAGAGMRDDNIFLSFARMIRRHIIKST